MPEAVAGFATLDGTTRFAERFLPKVDAGHFREALGLRLSSIGLGSYLGDPTDEDDRRYEEAVTAAVARGTNVLDTAINYRCQRSERAFGATLGRLFAAGSLARDEVVICTKGGYLPFDGAPPASREEASDHVRRAVLDPGLASPGEIVGEAHCMAPAYLRDQIRRSLANLGLGTLDVYYLHNPEQQLAELPRREFLRRIREAFETLEEAVAEGAIRAYGAATWNGLRNSPEGKIYLSLDELVEIAREVGGLDHHFRVVQLPFNLAMHEALSLANQRMRADGDEGFVPLLQVAPRLGVAVVASASILQGRLARELPDDLDRAFPGLASDAQRALQFSRSVPGVTTALVGMRDVRHVEENLGLAAAPTASEEALLKLFRRA